MFWRWLFWGNLFHYSRLLWFNWEVFFCLGVKRHIGYYACGRKQLHLLSLEITESAAAVIFFLS